MITWVYGNTGAGKTTRARKLATNAVLLDADELRECLAFFDLSEFGRRKFNLAVAKIAKNLNTQGFDVVVATICPYRDLRKQVKEITGCKFIYLSYAGDDKVDVSPFERD